MPRAATRIAWPGFRLIRKSGMDSGATAAATSRLTVIVLKPAWRCAKARSVKPLIKMQTMKKRAFGLVLASVISTAKSTTNVTAIKPRSYQSIFRFLLKAQEPRLTVIAPTTPIA